jgi:hypothetical protein
MTPPTDPSDDIWIDEEAGPVVRPYAMTRGRTQPSRGKFDLISLVAAARTISSADIGLGPEHVAIMNLCVRPLSVAEVAAHLDLPVGIVRVLLGDLLDKGLILVRQPQSPDHAQQQHILEAVIDGLRSI